MRWLVSSAVSSALLATVSFASPAFAAAPDHWVATWAASPMSGRNTPPPPRPAPPAAAAGAAGATAATPPAPPRPMPPPFEPLGLTETTFREIVHVSMGGSTLRIVFTNEFGNEPLTISAANVAVSAGQDAIQPATLQRLLFNGKPSMMIPAGAMALSDPVSMKLAPLSDLTISFVLPAQTITQLTVHQLGDQTNYSLEGSHASDASLPDAKKYFMWEFLKGVEVLAPASAGAIATVGDSITDGAFASRDGNARWPDELARRLQADKKLSTMAVINEGISGNRVLHDGAGPSALARFDRDVIAEPGVKYVIFLEAINDIGNAYNKNGGRDVVSADDLIGGYMQMIERAHQHGIKVIGATLTPYGGAGYSSPAGEAVRTALNDWIRTSKLLDGVIDFDKVTRDPAHPDTFLPAYDHGDHLHPGDVGYKAMGDAIDLQLFTK